MDIRISTKFYLEPAAITAVIGNKHFDRSVIGAVAGAVQDEDGGTAVNAQMFC